jgi:peroxiredoxin family protein
MQALEEKLRGLEQQLAHVQGQMAEDRVALVVFSGDLDRVLAAFIIATGAASMGQQVSMFFTFWGLSVVKKGSQLSGKTLFQKMMALMSPGVRMIACEMSRDLMGIKESELDPGLECGGVATFLADSLKSRTSLFL